MVSWLRWLGGGGAVALHEPWRRRGAQQLLGRAPSRSPQGPTGCCAMNGWSCRRPAPRRYSGRGHERGAATRGWPEGGWRSRWRVMADPRSPIYHGVMSRHPFNQIVIMCNHV